MNKRIAALGITGLLLTGPSALMAVSAGPAGALPGQGVEHGGHGHGHDHDKKHGKHHWKYKKKRHDHDRRHHHKKHYGHHHHYGHDHHGYNEHRRHPRS